MDRSSRRLWACLVASPLSLAALVGCGQSSPAPVPLMIDEGGVAPQILPRVEDIRSLNAAGEGLAPRARLAERIVVPEVPLRLPPVDEVEPSADASESFDADEDSLQAFDAQAGRGAQEQESFEIIPLPPVTESTGPDEEIENPYVASVPQSIVIPPATEADQAVPPALELPEPDAVAATPQADSPSEPIADQAGPQFNAGELDIEDPSMAVGDVNNLAEIKPLPPVADAGVRSMAAAETGSGHLMDVSPRALGTANNSPALAQVPGGASRSKAMRVISEQAAVHVRRGMSLAGRGAHYSARSEFIQALRVISQSLDVANNSQEHTQALSAGLRALDEADDFVPHSTELEADLNLGALVRSHRTPVLKDAAVDSLRPLAARQQYYTFAQQQLALASAGDRSGSMALFGLARVRQTLAEQQPVTASQELPKAMALHQAAILADGDNFMAANELGVLLARYGQYESARTMLEHSARIESQPATWHNLAVVYQNLGEGGAAQSAKQRAEQLAHLQRSGQVKTSPSQVEWKSVPEFNQATARDQAPPVQTPTTKSAQKGNTQTK